MTTNDGWTDEQYIEQLRAEVEKQRRELEELRVRVGHAEGQASAHRAKGRAEGFERAREMAASVARDVAAERMRHASNPELPSRRREAWTRHAGTADRIGEGIRTMRDDGGPVDVAEPSHEQEHNRTCECGQPERAHDERGCFAWGWINEADGKRFWGPSRCTGFRPRSS
jgi:hypothetical protein